MNKVSPNTPIEEIVSLVQIDGYVLLEDALSKQRIEALRIAYDIQIELQSAPPERKRVEIKRILEQGAEFANLMDLPTVFPIVRQLIGADVELASGGELDHKFGPSPAHIGWHNDFQWMTNVPYPRQNFWIRCTYFIDDVSEEMGPFTLLPGSHLSDRACPQSWKTVDGQPTIVEGQIGIVGKAGSCLINNTEIWHTNTPNTTMNSRRLIMILYKHAWMKSWQEGYELSTEFSSSQTDPLRKQLCGQCVWHQSADQFPAFPSCGKDAPQETIARIRAT